MKVSVVIPVYNEEKYIKNCLDSLLTQVEKPDEIIVIDNNSNDKTIEIVKKYKNIRIIKETIQGMTPARNTGFNATKYEIIAKCDADTILPFNWIKNIKENFDRNSLIVGISMPIKANDFFLAKQSQTLFYIYMFIPRLLIGFYPFIGPSYVIKKTGWNKIKNEICLNDKIVHEDIDLSLHIKKLGTIYHDKRTVIISSARRVTGNPLSFFGEYIYRFFKMYWNHRHLINKDSLF